MKKNIIKNMINNMTSDREDKYISLDEDMKHI